MNACTLNILLPFVTCCWCCRLPIAFIHADFTEAFFSFLTTIITITVTIIIVIIVFVVIIIWLEYCLQDWCAAADGLR